MATTKTYNTESGVTYTVSDTSYLLGAYHSYDVKITAPDGTVLLNQQNINRGIDVLGLVQLLASGDVITGPSDSSVLIQLASVGTYVSVPGATGNFVIGVGALTANTYYIGGTTSIEGLANLVTGSTINVAGGTATLTGASGSALAGVLNGSTVNIEYGGTFKTGSALASVLEGSTVNFGNGGGTIIINGGGTVISLLASGSLNATTFQNYDPSKDTIELQNTTNVITHYNIENGGVFGLDSSQKVVTLYDTNNNTVAQYAVSPASGVTLNNGKYQVNAQNDSINPLKITYSDGNTYIGACFLAGSMVRTLEGDKAVETLKVGDKIITFSPANGEATVRSITWVGKTQAHVRPGLANDEAGYPVRIMKDAIETGVPYKDMLLTSEHCLFFNGQFIPVRMLVNGRSIIYDTSIPSYDYYHIETEDHSVIMADGVLTESYLDTGNRKAFRQEGNVVSLSAGAAKSWEQDSAAPLCVARDKVEPLYHMLSVRAQMLSLPSITEERVLTQDSDLHLVTDKGQIIRQFRTVADKALFMIPADVSSVRIVSRASRPSDAIGPFVDDRRSLGVLIGEISLLEATHPKTITAHLTTPDLGGWDVEENMPCRWTNGDAILPLGNRKPQSLALLSVQILAAGPYLATQPASNSQAYSA